MSDDFFIPEERLVTLKATPAGRSSEGGYNYQRAYAVARLAAMLTAQTLLGLSDYPKRLRYDWADDLDELLGDGSVCFTQCKRVDDIGAPAKLAQVLAGFAPKWLWSPAQKRPQVRFRLVSCDPRFDHGFKKDTERAEVWVNFKSQLTATPSPQSDRAKWQNEADSIGHERLFDALWVSLEFVYLPKEVILTDTAGALLPAERAALDHLMQRSVIWGETQKDALACLRRLLHENLITFDPADLAELVLPKRPPHTIDPAEVGVALFAKEKDASLLPFIVVDRIHLANARRGERKRFLFEVPEWHHVVHGEDEHLKFIERDQTVALANDVRERLIAPLLRGTGSLSALFVTGPPGAGKSTLVRRVAAQLIETGEVVVADAGHNLANNVPGGIEPYIRQITKLAQQGRPVLLVLDDPLTSESEWIDLLQHLKRPGLQLAVISPTPDFLYHNHQHELRGVQVHTFSVNPPSATEKQALARLYELALNKSENLPDDFLVMVAEAAEGKPFPEIMQRLWETLNGGQGISSNVTFKALPWQVRAFWFVCALHRAYTPCPLPILQAALAQSGGTDNQDVSTALAKLEVLSGWSIFRIFQSASSLSTSGGKLVSTSHQKIASVAWDKRPGSWLDREMIHFLAEATLLDPISLHYVAQAAGTLAKTNPNPDSRLADALMRQWMEAAAKEPNLETRNLCSLAGTLRISGGHELVQQMFPLLLQRATGHHGWLAALQLRYLSADKEPQRSFPRAINLGALIADADFSIAPSRATQFFNAAGKKEHREAVILRLCAYLDRTPGWHINSALLTWLVSNAPQSKIIRRLDRLQQWLYEHTDNAVLRTQYLAFIRKLPKGKQFDQLRKEAAAETAQWLADSRHEHDTSVRTQYLAFIQQLPKEKQFDQLREQAATKTAQWLADSRHEHDTVVRTQFLVYAQQLPSEFNEIRKQTALNTAEWLKKHPENFDVCTGYVSFLLNVRHPDLAALEAESVTYHQWIIAKNPATVGSHFIFGEQLLRLKKFAEAKAEYEQVLTRNPEHQLTHRGKAIALQNLGEIEEAEDSFKRALYWARKKGGNLAMFHTPLGVFYLSQKRWPEAIKSFKEAGKESPEFYGNHWGIAKAQNELGKLPEAKQSLERALADPGLHSPEKEELEVTLTDISQRIAAQSEE
jgi:tetratricopeptide (TPR) repeat protein